MDTSKDNKKDAEQDNSRLVKHLTDYCKNLEKSVDYLKEELRKYRGH